MCKIVWKSFFYFWVYQNFEYLKSLWRFWSIFWKNLDFVRLIKKNYNKFLKTALTSWKISKNLIKSIKVIWFYIKNQKKYINQKNIYILKSFILTPLPSCPLASFTAEIVLQYSTNHQEGRGGKIYDFRINITFLIFDKKTNFFKLF